MPLAIDRAHAAQFHPGLLLQWHVTERCNFRCAHCYQENYAGAELSFEEELDVFGQFKDLLKRLGDEKGVPVWGHVTVTGGEPFIRDDFTDLLEVLAADRDGITFAILTNGSFIDGPMAARLKALGTRFVQVSIDGDREMNDALRVPGAYDAAVAALQHLVREGVRTLISFTASRKNYRDFPTVARLGRELRVTRVWADRLIPAGQGAAMQNDMLTPEETREFFGLMQQARAEALQSFGRTEIHLGRALQFLVGGGRPYHCGAGDRLLTLQPNGDVLPCRRMPIPVGNVKEKSLSEIYFDTPLLQELRDADHPIAGCEECAHAAACGGGLRCLSYAVTGSPFNADPGCRHARRDSQGVATGVRCPERTGSIPCNEDLPS